LENSFITIAFSLLAAAAAAMAISGTLRLYQEESALRAETIVASAIGRIRWAASHIVFAIVGSAAAILIAGVVAGLTYGIASGDVGGKVAEVLGVAAFQLPAIWMLVAIPVALFGLVPRFTPVAWGVLVAFVAVYFLGSVAGVSR
jgi:ABC-2 type transport system permease protein